jgi:hypothetical protein
MPLRTKFGLGLAALGMSIAGACILWSRTRNFIPVDRPVSPLAGQSVTSSFTPNFDGLYLIQIEAQPAIPPDQLSASLELTPTRGHAARPKRLSVPVGSSPHLARTFAGALPTSNTAPPRLAIPFPGKLGSFMASRGMSTRWSSRSRAMPQP